MALGRDWTELGGLAVPLLLRGQLEEWGGAGGGCGLGPGEQRLPRAWTWAWEVLEALPAAAVALVAGGEAWAQD